MEQNSQTIGKKLVLIGGGHSHAIALKMFGLQRLKGVSLTLITKETNTPYSGMLPGHIAGFYNYDECHINLKKLADFAQANLCIDEVIGLDLEQNQVICANSPPVTFDILSIDIGSTPAIISVSGAAEFAIPAKPVSQLLKHWYQLLISVAENPQVSISIGIVGGGAGGVELALSMQAHLQKMMEKKNLAIHLFHRHQELMTNYHDSTQHQVKKILTKRGIKLYLGEKVCEIEPNNFTLKPHSRNGEILTVKCESGLTVECDRVFWVTQASAPQWLKATGLATDEQGFILVNNKLQSLTHPHIFAAGDIAAMLNYPRPKAGVFAVKQGKPLFENLQRFVLNKPLEDYKPQREYLSLIGTGDGRAIANKGDFTLPPHKLLWYLKDWIDCRFMEQFREGLEKHQL
ncbi:FAD-dependent oxidoreductase [Fortiea contorta]|uniref:FAD-dependent oxidoreductase n=1 Tax=Fortiea contorta TaxID=1892405 RepID=UPI00034B7C73|nr:FAD-dependent oxidoreductase [Fortiea contorta]